MLVAIEKTVRSHWSRSAATQRLAPNARPLAAAGRYIDGTAALRHAACSTQVTCWVRTRADESLAVGTSTVPFGWNWNGHVVFVGSRYLAAAVGLLFDDAP